MNKILKSAAVIAFVAAIAVGATSSYFSDTETSVGNTFTAGSIDLKIDNTAHYNGMICKKNTANNGYAWQQDDMGISAVETENVKIGGECFATWDAKDLDGERFFDYADIKPGDWGENTLSFHVYDNDAWGRVKITAIENRENLCTEPEKVDDTTCSGRWCGELAQNMYAFIWVDNGCKSNTSSSCIVGNNIYEIGEEVVSSCTDGISGPGGYVYCPILSSTDAGTACTVSSGGQNDLPINMALVTIPSTGGISLEGDVTNYLGVAWFVPKTVGNIIQTDSIKANISFEVVQQRNNPTPFVD